MRLLFQLLAVVAVFGSLRVSASVDPTLAIATDRDIYLADSRHTVYLELRIGAPPADNPAASPNTRNIAFVLDRSGSMAGEPIQTLRRAVSGALHALSPRDTVSVVLFGSEVETLVEARRVDQVENPESLLAKVEASGGAALYDALNQGAAQLRRYAGPATINQLVLVTGGRATKGPRETDDFSRLVGLFAREGFTLSTIGLGENFNEDELAALARAGNGHFRYADRPEKLEESLIAEVAPQRTQVARDATLKVEFDRDPDDIKSYGWTEATIKGPTATYHWPAVFAGQDVRILLAATMRPQRFPYRIANVSLSWTTPDGQSQQLQKPVSVSVESDEHAVRRSVNPTVVRSTVDAVIGEAMQDAIEQIDKGDFRRAARTLRRARIDSENLNEDPQDADVAAKIRQLDAYLAEVQARGMNRLDRKVLRSGLFNQFDPPAKEDTQR